MTDVLVLVSDGLYKAVNNKDVFKINNSTCKMRHSKSEDFFKPMLRSNATPVSAISEDLISCTPSARIDPVDSIRDIVSENDFYRFVLFKRHYDKYIALSTKYEEAKGLVYYLEERYIELKTERDKLQQTRWMLEKKLEGCESELRDKEEELFLQLERSLRVEDEIERVRIDRDTCRSEYDRLERDQAGVLRQLHLHTAQNEITRRSLERARQEVIKQATIIRTERDALEQENEVLKEKLRLEQNELGAERLRREEGMAALTQEAVTLRHTARHMRAAALHATACRSRRRCSVCIYAKRTFFTDVDDFRNDGKLFKCFQAPFQDLRSWLLPPSVPSSVLPPTTLDCEIGYIDESSSSEDEYSSVVPVAPVLANTPPTCRAFSSDSGFSSEIGDRRSRSYECSSSHKSESCNSENTQPQSSLHRSKWTLSIRKLLIRKTKSSTVSQS